LIPALPQDPYALRDGWLQTLDARTRLSMTLLFVLCTALLPDGAWGAYLLLAALAAAGMLAAGLPARAFYLRSLLALPFVLAALPLLWTLPGPLWVIPGLNPAWAIHLAGLERLLSISLRAWLSVQAAVLLVWSTPFAEVLSGLRWLRVPRLLTALIGLMWRYLFVMAHAARQMMLARAARSAPHPGRRAGGSLPWRARVTGGMAGSLLVRSFEQGERIYAAMLARGYDGEPRSLPSAALTQRDWLWLAACAAALLLAAFWGFALA
jgi:cobalt/nickel transport system permease protein